MRRSIALVCVLHLSSTGCLVVSHPPSDPVPLADFCGRFFDALCDPLAGCACGPAATARCRAEERMICSGFPSSALEAAVADGSVGYDSTAAGSLLSRLQDRGCDGFVSTLDWRVRDLFDLGGVFVGTRGAGEPCASFGFELISVCQLGSCTPSGEGGVCRTSAREGERCDRTHQCVDLDRALDLGGAAYRLTLRCESEGPGSEEGTCRPWTEVGGACLTDAACWTERCVDEVCAAAALGGPCLSTRECAPDAYCASLVCALGGAPVDAMCDDAAACASMVCVGGACLTPGCDTF